MLLTLLMPNACETSDPASLPRRPISNFPSSDVALHVLPPASAPSTSLPLEIDAMRARQYPGSDIVIEQVLDIAARAAKEIVHANHIGTLGDQTIAKVRTQEARSTGDQYSLFQMHRRVFYVSH